MRVAGVCALAALLGAVTKRLGPVPIIAEDLGRQTPQALALRDKYGFPGMRLLQFGFGDEDHNLPHAYPRNCVAYTGTHDNQTIAGWYENLKRSYATEFARAVAYVGDSEKSRHWNFIRALFTSVANTVIIPMQDYLGLSAENRMNTPGITRGNWGWRMSGPISDQIIERIRALAEVTRRTN